MKMIGVKYRGKRLSGRVTRESKKDEQMEINANKGSLAYVKDGMQSCRCCGRNPLEHKDGEAAYKIVCPKV